MNGSEPCRQFEIVGFLCNWCSYAGADLAGTTRLSYPAAVRIVRLPCSGRMNLYLILRALARGADGIIISGCHPGDCHYVSGNYLARRRLGLFRELLSYVGIEERRFTYSWVSAAEDRKWGEVVERACKKLAGMTQPPGIFKMDDLMKPKYYWSV